MPLLGAIRQTPVHRITSYNVCYTKLLRQKGYFRQILSLDGWQQELYPDNDWYNMPVTIERDAAGKSLRIEVEVAGEKVRARIWRVQIGRVPLYLSYNFV